MAFIPCSYRGAMMFESSYRAHKLNLAIMLYSILFFGGAFALLAFSYLTRNINF